MTTDVLDTPKKIEVPLYAMAAAAKQVGVTTQTLKVYKKHGFVSPRGNGKTLYYTASDIKWMCCLRELIHVDKLSIGALKKLLEYAPCWEIKKCSPDERAGCLSSGNMRLPGSSGGLTLLQQHVAGKRGIGAARE